MILDVGIPLAILVGTVIGLWIGARLFVDNAVDLARRFEISELIVGLTIVAVGTSLPELVVTVDAVLAGADDVAVGNVVGSNLYNLAFVLGVVVLSGSVAIPRSLARRDGVVLFVATALGALVLLDLHLARFEGALLLLALVAYLTVLARADSESGTGELGTEDPGTASDRGRLRPLVLLGLGLALVIASGHLLVEVAVDLARTVGVSEWAIGSTVVAAGTSTPEFAVSVVALWGGRPGVSVGNLLGSNVFNVLGVLGFAGVVGPVSVDPSALADLGWLLVVTGFVTVSLWTGHRLSRTEGGLLVASELLRWALDLLR
ncbi:calcium/sodium antiporter [Natronorarus salvus]|uniref:calcium/sodium antiporter n=1 Tax=Natronorarus salvus TaxID=3117733 RepID=UPI002F26B717